MNTKFLLHLSLNFFLLVIVPVGHAAQTLAKVMMTTGSFSEREAGMYVAQDYRFLRRLRTLPPPG